MNNTYNSTTTSVTNHKVLARAELVHVREVSTVDCRGFWLAVKDPDVSRDAHVGRWPPLT